MHLPSPQSKAQRAAKTSLLAALCLTLLKLVVGWQTHSLGILAEAAHSALDLIAAAITVWAVKVSSLPADEDHHFGHGKIENISALAETFLLWLTCVWITFEAVSRLLGKTHPEIEPTVWAFLVIIISIVVDFFRSRDLYKTAQETHSQALAADALHFHSDIYGSIAVLIGLVGVLFGFQSADGIAALLVAGWTFMTSIKLVRESFDQLMDKAPEGAEQKIKSIINDLKDIKGMPLMKVRKSGPALFINLTISLDKSMSFESAHNITEILEESIRSSFGPETHISVHAEPV